MQLVERVYSNSCCLEVECLLTSNRQNVKTGTQMDRRRMLVVDVLIFLSLFEEITSTVLDYTASDEVET
jgi:hypothetical protein